jgi:hypothetical protein
MSLVSERPTGSARLLLLFGVDVVQAIHAALVVLAADVEVEAEGSDGGDSTPILLVTLRSFGVFAVAGRGSRRTYSPKKANVKRAL